RDATADETVELSVRAAGDRVRVRLRGLDRAGATVWAERVEGTRDDPFATEDGVVATATTALRARAATRRGPDGPLRARYEAARDVITQGIGRLLCWCGRVSEGLHRLELAARLDPDIPHTLDEKVRTLALIGDRAGAERDLARLDHLMPTAGIMPRLRLFVWWEDRAIAAKVV